MKDIEPTNLVLYPYALCNLNCRYCYIDKNPTLKEIDNDIEASFLDENYYFDFTKDFFKKEKLTRIDFWGGEPTLGFHRMHNLLYKLLDYYPNIDTFMSSTNFTIDNWEEEFFGLLNILGQYPTRKFLYILQLSIDGPEEINDPNRGTGVTKIFIEHFYSLANHIDDVLPDNVSIRINFKQTLTDYNIASLLTKESIINYFKFFDDLITYFNNTSKKVQVSTTLPNTAIPSNTTVEDGKRFAKYTELAYEITKENMTTNQIFKNYKNIISFRPRKNTWACPAKDGTIGFCGAGTFRLGLLPNKKVCICHSGFVDYMEEYKNVAEKNIEKTAERCIDINFFKMDQNLQIGVFTLEEYEKYKPILVSLSSFDSCAGYSNLYIIIKMLAKYGHIDKQYFEDSKALEATSFINDTIPNCIRNNINITGNLLGWPFGIIKLLLNGAKEYIDAGEDFLRRIE